MTHDEAAQIGSAHLLPIAAELYGLEDYEIRPIEAHDGGRNLVYSCDKDGAGARILRIAFLDDRSREDLLGEAEYIRYLFEHGGSVANVIGSRSGNLVEEVIHSSHAFFICLFEKARGRLLAENHYRYREGVPIAEYYHNCGEVLGKLHQLSKEYVPVHRRHSFFDKYNVAYIDELIPASLTALKDKMAELLEALAGLERDRQSFGMIHFDYNDGNYAIDFDTGQITVFDFDSSCFGWYMYDLADLWSHGVGWIRSEPDAGTRRAFMDAYFETALAGYRTQTRIEDSMLERLALFVQVTVMENIIDAFEVMRLQGEKPECDAELSYLIRCLEDDIPYRGFFHDIYSCDRPFAYERRDV